MKKACWRYLLLVVACPSLVPFVVAQGHIPDPIAPARRAGTAVRIELVGDSTQSWSHGYGAGFCANILAAADCVDMAKGGTSSKTYREEGVWEKALASKPDYMLIQFGHNDVATPAAMPRQTTIEEFTANIKRFVTEARAAEITPVLITPLSRRFFGGDNKIHSDLEGHAAAVRSVAAEMHVPLIDLHAESVAYLDNMGPDSQRMLSGMTITLPNGKVQPDRTHINVVGSYTFGRMVAVDLAKSVPDLAKYVRPEPAPTPSTVQPYLTRGDIAR